MPKLNQVIAVEKTVKTRVQVTVDSLYKAIQKPALFDGFVKSYEPTREDEVGQPTEQKKVQYTVPFVLSEVKRALTDLFAVAAQKDFANIGAAADIEVEGVILATGVPTTYLLFLEKQLTDLHTLISKLPTLDPAEEWSFDDVKKLWKTEKTKTQRTRKVSKPIVLYQATPEHPAQTQLINEDIVVGVYEQIKLSGATTETAQLTLLSRIEKVQEAVKFAREKANLADAPKQDVGAKVLGWVFEA